MGNPFSFPTSRVRVAMLQVYVPGNHLARINTASWRAFIANLQEERDVVIQVIPIRVWKGR